MTLSLLRPRRALAAGLATALAGSALALGAPARAAEVGADTFTWGFSQQVIDHLAEKTPSDGASFDANGVATFVDGTATEVGGVLTAAYQGTAKYAFGFGGTTIYSLTFSDPVVEVGADGSGSVSADVAWHVTGGFGQPAADGSADDLQLVTFDSATREAGTLSATPRWTGVVEPAAYGSGTSPNGESWDPELVDAIPSGLRPHFYASGSASDAKKPPLPFQASTTPAAAATPTVSIGSVRRVGTSTVLDVSGTGFSAVTHPGDAGVYVGLAAAGGLPPVDDRESGMDAFAAVTWVMPAQMPDGSWRVTLTAPDARIDRTKRYAVYTWQAHTHSNTTQDTETPVTLPAVPAAPAPGAGPTPSTPAVTKATARLAVTWVKRPRVARKAVLRTVVRKAAGKPWATGRVRVVVRKGGKKVVLTRKVKAGSARIVLKPRQTRRLGTGRWTIRVAYAGDRHHTRAVKVVRTRVRR